MSEPEQQVSSQVPLWNRALVIIPGVNPRGASVANTLQWPLKTSTSMFSSRATNTHSHRQSYHKSRINLIYVILYHYCCIYSQFSGILLIGNSGNFFILRTSNISAQVVQQETAKTWSSYQHTIIPEVLLPLVHCLSYLYLIVPKTMPLKLAAKKTQNVWLAITNWVIVNLGL